MVMVVFERGLLSLRSQKVWWVYVLLCSNRWISLVRQPYGLCVCWEGNEEATLCVRECTRLINGLMSALRFILSVCGERTKVALWDLESV